MQKAYRHLEVGDYVLVKSSRGPNSYANVAHVTGGGVVMIQRWVKARKTWTRPERLEAEALLCTVSKDEFRKETKALV